MIPIKNRLLLREKKQENGNLVVLPDNVERKPEDKYFEVLAVGKKVEDTKVGDTVIIANATRFSVRGANYFLTDEDNVMAIL